MIATAPPTLKRRPRLDYRYVWAPCLAVLTVSGAVAIVGQTTPPRAASGYTFTTNPAIAADFADPAILNAGQVYYAFATHGQGKHIQMARSNDLAHWTMLADALPRLPAWAEDAAQFVWAPDVVALNGAYLMYYVARDRDSEKQCVGVARSQLPQGPYTDDHPRPLVCQSALGGTIDPSVFSQGSAYNLYFKNDGNCCGMPVALYGQRLAPDGQSVLGQPVALLRNDQAWEGAVVEAPQMIAAQDGLYLFFSGNAYDSARYAEGYARCQGPLGPCAAAPENPILASDDHVNGPGGGDVFRARDSWWIAYHSWQGNQRMLWISQIVWRNGQPHILNAMALPVLLR